MSRDFKDWHSILLVHFSIVFFSVISPTSSKAQPWHEYSLEKLVNESCQPKLLARMRFLGDDRAFWSSVATAASMQLEGIASEGGIEVVCAGGNQSDILKCRAYYIIIIQRARTCLSLARSQVSTLLLDEQRNNTSN